MKIVMVSASKILTVRQSLIHCRLARDYQSIDRVKANKKEMRGQSRKQEKKENPDVMLINARQLASYFEFARMTN